MSSVVTAIPSGLIKDWCMQTPWFGISTDERQECADPSRGTHIADFETICCNGDIIDTRKNLFEGGHINISDLVCCQIKGPQPGGLFPITSEVPTECATGVPTPLASLAATNTDNVQGYRVTYKSASYGETTTGDFVPTETPYCLWAYTASGIDMTTVTLPPPHITTLSSTSYEIGSVITLSSSGTTSNRTTPATRTTNPNGVSVNPSSSGAQSSSATSATSSGLGIGSTNIDVTGIVLGWVVFLVGFLY